jgi:hypothetical protein
VSPTGLKWAVDPVADVVTTAGDLIYGTGADAVTRLGIGTAGQVLKVNSGATAPEWGAAAGGGANWSLLNSGGTNTTSGSTVTVSGISSADKIMVLCEGISTSAGSQTIRVRFNTDTGSNYYYFGYSIIGASSYNNINFYGTNASTTSLMLASTSSNAASVVNGYVLLSGCNAAGVKVFTSASGATAAGGNDHDFFSLGGYYNSSSTISSVSITTSGTFDAGKFYIYTSA